MVTMEMMCPEMLSASVIPVFDVSIESNRQSHGNLVSGRFAGPGKMKRQAGFGPWASSLTAVRISHLIKEMGGSEGPSAQQREQNACCLNVTTSVVSIHVDS